MIEARVSAIITAYNSEAFIAEAINSVLGQNCVVHELVVVDDGSIDGTRRVVAEFADQGIKYIHQENRGISGARNKGIRETTGEFIAFLDADDTWLENKTLLQINYLIAHPEAALVSGFAHWWNVSKDAVHISGKVPRNMNTLRREILVRNVLGNASMTMIRRAALAKVGLFNEEQHSGEDWELWQRLIARYEAAVIPEPLITYRWHTSNISHARRWKNLRGDWELSRRMILKSKPTLHRPGLIARSWSNYTYRRAMYAMQSNFPRWRQIWYALTAFLVYPFEMIREKLGAIVRSVFGDPMYQSGKRALRSLLQARGPQ